MHCTKTLEAGRDGDEFKRVTLLHFIHLCNVLFDLLEGSRASNGLYVDVRSGLMI